MKRLKFYLLTALTVLGLGSALNAQAQSWKGNTPSDGLEVVLYNVGSGMYLSGGKLWGTQTTLKTSAQYFTLWSYDGSVTYEFTNGTGGIGYGGDDPTGLYIDGQRIRFVFEEVETGSNTYYLKINTGSAYGKYLIAPSIVDAGGNQTGEPGGVISYGSKTDGDLFAQWILVTEEDRQNYFAEVANANNLSAQTTDGTFLIDVPDFARKNNNIGSSWTTNLTKDPSGWDWSKFDEDDYVYNPSRSSACTYIGNGYGGRAAYNKYFDMTADKDLLEALKKAEVVVGEDKMDKYGSSDISSDALHDCRITRNVG